MLSEGSACAFPLTIANIKAAIACDGRYETVTFMIGDEAICSYVVRRSRETRAQTGDPLSLLLEEESIPQFLWPAAEPFAAWLWRHPQLVAGQHVLELGSGCGLVGFVAARNAASVTLTDGSLISVAMLELGAEANAARHQNCVAPCFCAALRWGDEPSAKELCQTTGALLHCAHPGNFSFDVVIGSDIFYFNSSLRNGLRTARTALLGDGAASSSSNALRQKLFLCASFVRSDRMEVDLEQIPGEMGFQLLPDKVVSDGDDCGAQQTNNPLRIFKWAL